MARLQPARLSEASSSKVGRATAAAAAADDGKNKRREPPASSSEQPPRPAKARKVNPHQRADDENSPRFQQSSSRPAEGPADGGPPDGSNPDAGAEPAQQHRPAQSPDASDTAAAIRKHLAHKYDLYAVPIKPGSPIKDKVTHVLDCLENGFSFLKTDQKPGIVSLSAPSGACNKLLSVVEIAKRQLESQRYRWFQYNDVGVELERIPPRTPAGRGGRTIGDWMKGKHQGAAVHASGADDTMETDEEDAFETMASPSGHALRKKTSMSIYLARVPVPELEAILSSQTSGWYH